jgi:signal transduction histidine kinase
MIYGQPEQIGRIVANLIENALRYTPPGGSIEVGCLAERNAALIEVRDTGVGIAPGDLKHIFERFWRGAGPSTPGRSGLGLSIAQTLARSHGGSVRVASIPSRGSTLTVSLPLRRSRRGKTSTLS